jgi:hypothetical protein
LHQIQQLFLENPKFLPYVQGGPLPPLTSDESERLRWIVAMYCDVLNIGYYEQQTIRSTRSLEEWRDFCVRTLERSAAVRAEVEAKPKGYPLLTALLPAQHDSPSAPAVP